MTNQRAKYTPAHVANYILRYFFIYNKEITPLKLQKLLYIAYGWNLVLNKENPRLFDEPILAWKYGPVIPSIYYYFKDKTADRNKIDNSYVVTFDEKGDIDYNAPIIPDSDIKTRRIINAVLDKYGERSGEELVNKLHKKGSPWDNAYNKNGVEGSGKNSALNDDEIAERSRFAIDDFIESKKSSN
ncbi:MAG: DUF4065 domain-containing protein [Proteobacteria bacterium]|nr:DUF4065 domain-containing protein [Pseudomonadota bacterium]